MQTPIIFGQNKPIASQDTNLFTVTSSHQAQFSIFVANQGTAVDYFTIALVPNGQSLQTKNYIAFSTPIPGNGVVSYGSISMGAGDQVRISSSLGQCSFTATGLDVT